MALSYSKRSTPAPTGHRWHGDTFSHAADLEDRATPDGVVEQHAHGGVAVSSNWPERTAQTNATRKPPATVPPAAMSKHDDAHAGDAPAGEPAHQRRR